MLHCRLLIFFKINFFKNYFGNIIRVPNSLDSDQARHYVGPDLVPNCLKDLTLCMLYCRLLIFFKINFFFKIFFVNAIRVPMSLDSDQAQYYVAPDLVPNYLKDYNSVHALLSSADFFQNKLFRKKKKNCE